MSSDEVDNLKGFFSSTGAEEVHSREI
jgi:hypothetical protein